MIFLSSKAKCYFFFFFLSIWTLFTSLLEPGNRRHSVDYKLRGITENIKRDHVNSLLNISKYPQCFAGSHTLLRDTRHASDEIKQFGVILKRRYLLNNTRRTHIHTQDLRYLLLFPSPRFNIDSSFSLLSCLSCSLCWPHCRSLWGRCMHLKRFSREGKKKKR